MFTRAAKQQVGIFSLFFGWENATGRLEVIAISLQIRQAQPEVSPLHFPTPSWEAANYRYISDVMDGTRRLLRMSPGNVRKTEYRSKALSPGARGQHRWEFPTTWPMDHHTGYWQSIAIPKMGEQLSKSAWKAVLHQPTKQLRAAGEVPVSNGAQLTGNPPVGKTSPYPEGTPPDLTKFSVPAVTAHALWKEGGHVGISRLTLGVRIPTQRILGENAKLSNYVVATR